MHAQFAEVLKSAHASYQKTRSHSEPANRPARRKRSQEEGGKKGHQGIRRILPTQRRPNRHGASEEGLPQASGRASSSRPARSLKHSRSTFGSRRRAARRSSPNTPGVRCSARSAAVRFPRPRSHGSGVVSSATASRLGPSTNESSFACPYRLITATMEDMFCERTSDGHGDQLREELGGLLRPLREGES